MLENKQVDALVASKFALLAKESIVSKNKEIVLEGVRKEVLSLQELGLPEVCLQGCEFFKIEGTKPSDYRERVIYLNESDFILIGIRFYSLNVTKPFVSVMPSFLEVPRSIIDQIGRIVEQEFSVFKPLSFQMTLTPEFALEEERAEANRFTVVGSIDELLKEEIEPSTNMIELRIPAAIDFYDEYLREYEIFHETSPHLEQDVQPESYDDLKEALRDGLLFKIFINKIFAGVIAGSRNDYHGVSGVSILEEILFHEFKGQGSGVHIQRSFAEKIKDDYEILWGIIYQKNGPSLRTALRNGRRITETDYFFKINTGGNYES